MSDAELTVGVTGAVATVTIRNPGRRNAMTPAMWRRLPVLLDGLEADPAVRALVLTGADGAFCAGADLGDLDELLDANGDAGIAVAAEERLAAFAKPTVAAVQGPCVGGGCLLAVACDLRIVAPGRPVRGATGPARAGLPGTYHPAVDPARRPVHGQVPALHRRVDRRRAGAAGRPGRRGGRRPRPAGSPRSPPPSPRRSQLSVAAAKEIVDDRAGPGPDRLVAPEGAG